VDKGRITTMVDYIRTRFRHAKVVTVTVPLSRDDMTSALLEQLDHEPLIDGQGKLRGEPWGWVSCCQWPESQ